MSRGSKINVRIKSRPEKIHTAKLKPTGMYIIKFKGYSLGFTKEELIILEK